MSKKVYSEENIKAIADKLREKLNTEIKYKLKEMPAAIDVVFEKGKEAIKLIRFYIEGDDFYAISGMSWRNRADFPDGCISITDDDKVMAYTGEIFAKPDDIIIDDSSYSQVYYFTLDGDLFPYTGEPTWDYWVTTDFNTLGLSCEDGFVITSDGRKVYSHSTGDSYDDISINGGIVTPDGYIDSTYEYSADFIDTCTLDDYVISFISGMTWQDLADISAGSPVSIQDGAVHTTYYNADAELYYEDVKVLPTDKIIAGGSYTLYTPDDV